MNLQPSYQSRRFLARNIWRFTFGGSPSTAFTLIELILVMAILIIAVSITAPALASFFRGRTLDSEARRLLSLTREGQSRAISEGLPMELWVDQGQRAYGLEAEPSYEQNDSKAIGFALERDIQLQVVSNNSLNSSSAPPLPMSGATSSAPVRSNHPSLPRIRFLPDGSISETSPQMIELTGRDGSALWVGLARNRLNYEIRSQASR
jgi:Tfp pilus assembly protein FimT